MADPKDLYVMQDGTHAAQGDVTLDRWGVLRNKSGMAVAIDEEGNPQTVGTDAVKNMNVMEAERGKKAADDAAAMADKAAGRRPPNDARRASDKAATKTPPGPSVAELAKSTDPKPGATKAATGEDREIKAGEQSTSDPNYKTR